MPGSSFDDPGRQKSTIGMPDRVETIARASDISSRFSYRVHRLRDRYFYYYDDDDGTRWNSSPSRRLLIVVVVATTISWVATIDRA